MTNLDMLASETFKSVHHPSMQRHADTISREPLACLESINCGFNRRFA